MRASINIEPVRIGLAMSVDCEHGRRMDLFVPASTCTTYPVNQVGYNVMLVIYVQKNGCTSIVM